MSKRKSRTFYVPGGLSSIFENCFEGKRSLEEEGARGGGFRLRLGTYTYAEYSDSDCVIINGNIEKNAKTTLKVIELFRQRYDIQDRFKIYHKIELPMGCGFGTSGSGALGAVFALADLCGINDSYCNLTNIAHDAEILALTGLGTVSGLGSFRGACGLIIEPGSPCNCKIKELEVDENDVLISLVFSPINKAEILISGKKRAGMNRLARELMSKIEDAYSLLKYSRIFAEKAGFADYHLRQIMRHFLRLGFKEVAQNMIG
ncbi:MAG TPA: hypothetical protein VKU94_03710, partial [Geobacterales bacterium]|nr:hypothetical protein [Geobacterales bacterium]